jgi:hypothetical protein
MVGYLGVLSTHSSYEQPFTCCVYKKSFRQSHNLKLVRAVVGNHDFLSAQVKITHMAVQE